ncbi:hypothetical protein DL98DRAFT_136833 [Cadophora sp. DSE1049]|nr:hypothetical protein DL98DRAFT_136833 [Cadophora sp. DSE1049]
MLCEIDAQLGLQVPNLVVSPVGVGSLAQAIVTHYKAPQSQSQSPNPPSNPSSNPTPSLNPNYTSSPNPPNQTSIVIVEPHTAASSTTASTPAPPSPSPPAQPS